MGIDSEIVRKAREDFERFYCCDNKNILLKGESGRYINTFTQDAWNGWLSCYHFHTLETRHYFAIRYNQLNSNCFVFIKKDQFEKRPDPLKRTWLNFTISGFEQIRSGIYRSSFVEYESFDRLSELGFHVIKNSFYFNNKPEKKI